MSKIRVLLADDHAIVRQGIRVLVEAQPDIDVVGEAENGRQAVQMTNKLKPDVVVMDLAMPLLNGLEATRQILKENPDAKVLVLSSYSDREYVRQLTEVGATGYLLKQTAADDLIKAVREARRGNSFFSPTVCRRLVEHCRNVARRGPSASKRKDVLTTREAEVLQLIAEGQPNKSIAVELGISIKTVEKHRQQVMYKLDIHDIAGLTRYAVSRGMVETTAMEPMAPVTPLERAVAQRPPAPQVQTEVGEPERPAQAGAGVLAGRTNP